MPLRALLAEEMPPLLEKVAAWKKKTGGEPGIRPSVSRPLWQIQSGVHGIMRDKTPRIPEINRKTTDWDKDAQDRYAETPDKGHGRIDQRSIQTCTLVKGAVKMPHAAQVFRIRRCREHVSSNDPGSTEFAYGVTSLTRKEAGAKQLLALNRGHWTVENGNHRRRDGILGEDSCRMRTRHGPANNALFNNMALAIIFQAGYTNLAAATDACQSKRNKGFRTITKPSSLRCPGKS